MPHVYLDHYRCARCDYRIVFAHGEWICECWAVGDAAVEAGIEDLPPSWIAPETAEPTP